MAKRCQKGEKGKGVKKGVTPIKKRCHTNQYHIKQPRLFQKRVAHDFLILEQP